MAPDFEVEGIDDAAADAPTKWVAVAFLGLVMVAVGLLATLLGAVGFAAPIVSAVPPLAILFEFALVPVVVGVGLFVLAITEWEPGVQWH